VAALERRLGEEETANADLQGELEQLRAQLVGAAPSDRSPSTPERKRPWYFWPRRVGLLAALMLVCSVGGPSCGLCAASCEGYRQTLDESLATCPAVKKLLGDDPALSHVGLACGSTKSGGGTGTASWNLPVSGSRARGTLSVSLEKHGGQWAMTRGELSSRGDSVDLVQCARRMKDPDAVRGAMYDRLRGQCDGDNCACRPWRAGVRTGPAPDWPWRRLALAKGPARAAASNRLSLIWHTESGSYLGF